VTTAGSGPAGGWAGTYVTIQHADGFSTLYAHLAAVTVSVGETVSAGQRIGSVGMTGRTFGPHLHFEVYPAGVTPGDVYSAVDPRPWLAAHR
jgi:murein DD-endopeptidase MepM/ murein hydrolase activator NlpD